MKKIRHFLSIEDLSSKELWEVLKLGKLLKTKAGIKKYNQLLKNKSLYMLTEKPSLRTTASFAEAAWDLGGNFILFGKDQIDMGGRESAGDISRVVSRWAAVIAARVKRHTDLVELAKYASVPVVNALSDLEHPCQVLADILTIWEHKKTLKGLKVAYLGNGNNNVTHSFALACNLLDINFRCASPKGFEMSPEIIKKSKAFSTNDPLGAVKEADVVVTDVWTSMGDEAEKEKRIPLLMPYQVNKTLMSKAKKDAIFLHCLPAHRGEEVTDEVIDSSQSVVFDEAENRQFAQMGLIVFLLK